MASRSKWLQAVALGGLVLSSGKPSWGVRDQSAEPVVIDSIPDLGAQIRSQWNLDDAGYGTQGAADDVRYFGRLRDDSSTQKLTLADCVALALANNTSLQIARLGPLGAEVAIRGAQSVFDPVFYANAGLDRFRRQSTSYAAVRQATVNGEQVTDLEPFNSGALAFFLGPPQTKQHRTTAGAGLRKLSALTGAQMGLNWRAARRGSNSPFQQLTKEYTTELEISLNQPLLRDFGLQFTTLQVRIAEKGASAAAKQYEASLSDLIKRVETAYWLLIGTGENVAVRELGLQVARELLRQNEGKFAVGTVPRTSVLEAKADVARREADVIQANKLHTNARDALRAILNVKDANSDSLIIVEPSDIPEGPAARADLAASLKTALERRAELAAARLGVEGDSMELKIAQNQLLPRLNAFATYGVNGLAGDRANAIDRTSKDPILGDAPDGEPRPVVGANEVVTRNGSPYTGGFDDALGNAFRGDFYSYAAGLILEIPLDNAQAKAQYARSRVSFEQSRLGLRQLQETVTAEVKKAVNDLQADSKAIEATKLARELAEENVRNQQARYDVGLGTTKDLLDFQDALTQARAAEVQSLTQYRIDLAELRRVEGSLLSAHNVEIADRDRRANPWWASF